MSRKLVSNAVFSWLQWEARSKESAAGSSTDAKEALLSHRQGNQKGHWARQAEPGYVSVSGCGDKTTMTWLHSGSQVFALASNTHKAKRSKPAGEPEDSQHIYLL